MKVQFFYRMDTFQIDAYFHGCKTQSPVFKDPVTYVEVNVEDPPFEISRDHKVILDDEGKVIDTEPSVNPDQPTLTPNPHQDLVDELKDAWPTLTAAQKAELLRRVARRLLEG